MGLIQWVDVGEALPLQVKCPKDGIVESILHHIRIVGVLVSHLHSVPKKQKTAGRTGLAVGDVRQLVVCAKSFVFTKRSNASGEVKFGADNVAPQGSCRALVSSIAGLQGNVRNA